MKYLHQEFEAGPDDLVEVTLDGQANVMLLDPENFDLYRKGDSFRYHGGLAKVSPMRLVPPRRGRWHVVVDLGGSTGHVRAVLNLYGAVKMPRLTEDQRQAIEERGGTPVLVVDEATNASYVLLRTEQYERMKALTGENDSEALHPLLADIDPEDWEDASHYGLGKP